MADDAVTHAGEDDSPTRRCWRCLRDFPVDAADVAPGAAGWWVCEACHERLFDKGDPAAVVPR